MELEQIQKSLNQKFAEALRPGEIRKIVFWYDTEGQFADIIDNLSLSQVKLYRLTDSNYFYTKYLLEVKDLSSNYLIYADKRPKDEDNWLIDTWLYSYEFHADRLVLIMEEHGIKPALRPLVKRYEKFFNNMERRKRLTAYGISFKDESTLEMALMSALCGLRYPDQQGIFQKVLGDSLTEADNHYLSDIGRFMDEEVFWRLAGSYFGYNQEEHSLPKLAAYILINSLRRTLDDSQLSPFKEYLGDYNRANCIYFVDRWMNTQNEAGAYDKLAAAVESILAVEERMDGLEVGAIRECDTFAAFDKKIIRYLLNSIADGIENFEFCLTLIEGRRTSHWYENYSSIYDALYNAVQILRYRTFNPVVPLLDKKELWERYGSDYFYMDYWYRNFYWFYDRNPVELLKPVRSMIENIYSNFLDDLGAAWSAAIAAQPDHSWEPAGIGRQQDFYQRELVPILARGERCFVIISDALRYEIATDIIKRLNAETAGAARIETMMGVLPSATKYGMAALLPHKDISLDDKGQVLVDEARSDSLTERENILQSYVPEAVAVHFRTLVDMNKKERRELIKGRKLIYIYHDSIDAIGDKSASEIKVFDAAHNSIDEIYRIIRIIRDDLSGVNIMITADHGFLYKRDPLAESDKIPKETVGACEEKRRYMLSHQHIESDALLRFQPAYLNCAGEPWQVYVPRAAIRFKVQGPGANFVHGGAALQEVVVPLVKYKAVRGSNQKMKEERKVKLKLINESRKITNTLFNLQFFQTEKVDEEHIARTVEIFFADEHDSMLSNRETVIADKTSDKPEERTFKIRFTLKNSNYDRNKDYFLMVRDVDTDLIEDKILYKINLGISSDFDL